MGWRKAWIQVIGQRGREDYGSPLHAGWWPPYFGRCKQWCVRDIPARSCDGPPVCVVVASPACRIARCNGDMCRCIFLCRQMSSNTHLAISPPIPLDSWAISKWTCDCNKSVHATRSSIWSRDWRPLLMTLIHNSGVFDILRKLIALVFSE